MEQIEFKHVNLAFGCKNGSGRHGDFKVDEKGLVICNHCNEDFNGELRMIYEDLHRLLYQK
jgi:hypothetical protein